MAEKKKAVKVKRLFQADPCPNKDCKFFAPCEYYSDGTYEIPGACMVCVFYMGIRFNAIAG